MQNSQIIIDVAITMGCILFAYLVRQHFFRFAKNSLDELFKTDSDIQMPKILIEGAEQEKERILNQIREIDLKAKLHLTLIKKFYIYYYTSVGPALLTGVVAAICLIFISKSGWDANRNLVIAFVMLSGITALWSSFPTIFQHEKNISNNKSKFIEYVKLENEILSYFSTGENIDGEKKELKDMIHYIDKQLSELHQIHMGIDFRRVPDYLSQLRK